MFSTLSAKASGIEPGEPCRFHIVNRTFTMAKGGIYEC